MNIKYKINLPILFSFGFMLLTLSCDDDPADDVQLPEISHRVIMTSQMDFENKVNLNDEITFGDVSVGVVSRTWTFPEGVANISGSENNTTSSEDIVQAFFTQLGDHEVKLHQTFQSSAYVGTEQRGTELDTTIVVRVLGNIGANLTANLLNSDGSVGEALTIGDSSRNEIMAGSTVRYSITTTGEPENYNWSFEGGDPTTSTEIVEELDVKYKKLGEYGFGFSANRARPEGGYELTYTNLVKIIPSTEPVTLDAIEATADGNIGLNFSREMEPTTIDMTNFSVSLANAGVEIPATIASVEVDPNEGNIVIISLENDRVYNDDTAIVSYTAGDLTTTDAYPAESFTDLPVVFKGNNILNNGTYDYSFENSTATNWPYQWWGAPWDAYNLEISTAQAQDGESSALIEFDPNGGMIIAHTDTSGATIPFTVEEGKTYEVGVWVYVETLSEPDTGTLFAPDLRFYWAPNTDWGVAPNPAFTSDFALNQWVYSSFLTDFGGVAGDFTLSIRGYNQDNSTVTRFYMDNLSISEAVLRP
ncbi:hypothetical protein [Maribacter dokdonensis]|uniref:hypothetical protein n=1 Tax=Maribacter dokdonensis TaxID=320912 RepID=UPI001C081425|nr:hypothetical protein [Maribacter dokdonensis]MBU2902123.1 hypothetical protein [Maribacter dokdonensis]